MTCLVPPAVPLSIRSAPLPVVGRLYSLQGNSYIEGHLKANKNAIQPIRQNDTIKAGSGSITYVWLLNSGVRYRLRPSSVVKVVRDHASAVRGLQPLRLATLGSETLRTLSYCGPISLPSQKLDHRFRVSPAGAQLEIPTSLSWEKLPGAVSYDALLLGGPGMRPRFYSGVASATSVKLPAHRLEKGFPYRLVLTAHLANGRNETITRTFRVLSAEDAVRLRSALADVQAKCGASPEAFLAKAEIYESYGRYHSAANCLIALRTTYPQLSMNDQISRIESLAEGG